MGALNYCKLIAVNEACPQGMIPTVIETSAGVRHLIFLELNQADLWGRELSRIVAKAIPQPEVELPCDI